MAQIASDWEGAVSSSSSEDDDEVSKKTLYAFNVPRQSFINLGVRLADTPLSRLRGLLGKTRLRSDEGVWVVPSHGIHTIGLMFPIDVIYLDAQFQVIHLVEHLGRFHIAPVLLKAASVLQLPAGSIASSGTQVGDQVLVRSPEQFDEYWAAQRPLEAPQGLEEAT